MPITSRFQGQPVGTDRDDWFDAERQLAGLGMRGLAGGE